MTTMMMSAKRLLIVLLGAFLITACGDDDTSASVRTQLTRMIQSEWTTYLATLPASAGGTALYLVTPDNEYFASTGIDNASPDIHFRAASNTKTFTAAAILLLHQEGRLNIDDAITSAIPGQTEPYVPATADYAIPYKNQITIKQLLSHRAGVFDVTNAAIPASCKAPYAGDTYLSYVEATQGQQHTFTFDELVGVVAHCQISLSLPGAEYHYSNTGYNLLGKIIERVSGLSYREFVTQRLLIPNQLFDTSFPVLGSEQSIPQPFAPGYFIGDGALYSKTEDNMSLNVAEGNVISTPRDLARWARRLFKGQAGLTAQTVAQMSECLSDAGENSCYGLGIWGVSDPQGKGHSGAHAGYLSVMLHDPSSDVTTIIFSNLLNYDATLAEMRVQLGMRKKAYGILGIKS